MSKITISAPILPELDKAFVPAALWNREYRKLAAADPNAVKVAITLKRSNGAISRFDTLLLPDTEENKALNFRYVERLVKFMLWAFGGCEVAVDKPHDKIINSLISRQFKRRYSFDGISGAAVR